MMDHPCFHCTLPECDDTHKRCQVRRLCKQYKQKLRNGENQAITEIERKANTEAWQMFKLNRQARMSA